MDKPLYFHLSPMQKVFVDGEGVCTVLSRKSQWLGYPTIPVGVEIPSKPNPYYTVPYISPWDGRTVETPKREPLMFLCQIDCRDIPEEVTDLPHDGELYFFADLGYYCNLGGKPFPMYSSKDYVGVVYVPEEKFEGAKFQSDFPLSYPPQRITLNFERPAGDEPENQLLGYPEHREWEDWDEPYAGWRLLFQMDSSDGPEYHFNFMDWGVFNILISPEDLKKRDFSKVVGIVLST